MRMLFPLEFRIDSIANSAPMLPFHYPLHAGRNDLTCPKKLEPFGTRGDAYIYYFVTTAHLAARHDFGTFKLKLADIAGFEERGETGRRGDFDSFVASFDDPGPRRRSDAPGGVGAHRRRTCTALSWTRTAYRDSQPFAPRTPPSRVAQHDAGAGGA